MQITDFSFHSNIDEVLLTQEVLQTRVKELAASISQDYKGRDLLLVSVLKGSLFFLADLIRCMTIPVSLDFIAISSYGEATKSSGVVRILKDLEENITGRHILIIEDIVDTGLTLGYLIKNLRLRGPASVKICSLLNKPIRRIRPVDVEYHGFDIDDKFVVGYGLDYAHRYRHLPFICSLKPEAIASPAEEALQTAGRSDGPSGGG